MSELGFDGGEVVRRGKPVWTGHLRRPLLVLAIAVLCAVSYLAGIWTGMNTHITCVASSPGQIVCGDGAQQPPPPVAPESGTA
jgi:hypothetical protein